MEQDYDPLDEHDEDNIFDLSSVLDEDNEDVRDALKARKKAVEVLIPVRLRGKPRKFAPAAKKPEAKTELKKVDEDDDVGSGPSGPPVLYYRGGPTLDGVPTREELVQKHNPKLHGAVSEQIRKKAPILFMPNDVYERTYEEPYRLQLFGVLEDGTKAHVVFKAAEVFFDVRVPKKDFEGLSKFMRNEKSFEVRCAEYLKQIVSTAEGKNKAFVLATKVVQRRPLKEYREADAAYIRLYFSSLKARKAAIYSVREFKFETANDDRSNHHRKFSRETQSPLVEWMTLSNYEYDEGRSEASPLCSHVFTVRPEDAKPMINPMADKAARLAAANKKQKTPHLAKDHTLVASWDIETYTSRKEQDLPLPYNKEDHCFCLSCTFYWKDSKVPLLAVCFIDKPVHPDHRWATVVCDSERSIYKGFALLWRALAPDIEIQFNGTEYDWPFLVERMKQTDDLGWFYSRVSAAVPTWRNGRGVQVPFRNWVAKTEDVYKWDYRESRIKITPEASFISKHLKIPGVVCFDMRVCFLKLYPKAEVKKNSSLKFYLKECKLPSKADMPIHPMWRGYESGDKEFLRKILHYNVIDCQRPQELALARNVYNDRRELAKPSFVSLYDAQFYADGMKVCNMLVAYALLRGLACSMIAAEDAEEGKYPGATVFPPVRGLYNDDPITGLDLESLYPSIIMALNLSPEKLIGSATLAAELKARGKKLHHISFPFNGRQVTGWSVRHEDRPADMGVYPVILMDLKDKRKDVKAILSALKQRREMIELVTGLKGPGTLKAAIDTACAKINAIAAAKKAQDKEIAAAKSNLAILAALPKTDAALQAEYDQIRFEYVSVDTEQKAIKVFMNTFYGEAGNKRSPSFMLLLAGGVTSAGQYIIKNAVKFAVDNGCELVYGDTDSMYVKTQQKLLAPARARYASREITKEQYWHELVQTTMDFMKVFVNEVNAHMEKLMESKYIKFAYEDVLFPVMFCGKKKYYAIAHVGVVNFHPKELFIRGIDIIKQGQTDLVKAIGNRIMNETMKISNERSMLEIVEHTLQDAMCESWEFKYFIQTATYKPDKDNKSVKVFVARMRVMHAREVAINRTNQAKGLPVQPTIYDPPEAGERFEFVLRQVDNEFDVFGLKRKLTKGDRMEYAHVPGVKVDMLEYLKKYAVGVAARFINFEKCFQPGAEYKTKTGRVLDETGVDKYSLLQAKKHLIQLLSKKEGFDGVRNEGAARRAAFKTVSSGLRTAMVKSNKNNSVRMLIDSFQHSILMRGSDAITDLVNFAKADAKRAADVATRFAKPQGDAFTEHKDAKAAAALMCSALGKSEADARAELATLLPKAEIIALRFDSTLGEMINDRLKGVESPVGFDLTAEDEALLAKVYKCYQRLVGVFAVRAKHEAKSTVLTAAKNKKIGYSPPPAPKTQLARDAADRIVSRGILPL